MLSGLISDTLLLKSPTTHPSDKVIAPELAELAGVNLEEYGLAMLKAGTNLASKSAEELIDIDAKTFELERKSRSCSSGHIQLILLKFWNAKLKSKQPFKSQMQLTATQTLS